MNKLIIISIISFVIISCNKDDHIIIKETIEYGRRDIKIVEYYKNNSKKKNLVKIEKYQLMYGEYFYDEKENSVKIKKDQFDEYFMLEENYKYGQLDGKKISYDRDGSILLEMNYKEGQPHEGKLIKVGEKGKLYYEVYKDGKIIETREI